MRFLTLILIVLSLSGCESLFRKTEYITIEKPIYIKPNVPQSLLMKCEAPKPTSKEAYMSLTQIEREATLSLYIIDVFKTLSNCNNNIKSIKEILDKQMEQPKEVKP